MGAKITSQFGNIDLGESTVTIGRLDSNTLVIKHPSVSGHHAEIRPKGDGTYWIYDMNSTNGLQINGQPIPKGAGAGQVLNNNDSITCGFATLTYTTSDLPGGTMLLDASQFKMPPSPPGGPFANQPSYAQQPAYQQQAYAPQPTYSAQPSAASAVKLDRVALALNRTSLQLEPGNSADLALTITTKRLENAIGVRQDQMNLIVMVEGLDPSWVKIPSTNVNLMPGATDVKNISISIPKTARTQAGLISFLIRVRDQNDPLIQASVQGNLQVLAVSGMDFDVKPATQTMRPGGAATYEVVITNQSNIMAALKLRGINNQDADMDYAFATGDSVVQLAPADQRRIPVTVTPRDRPWIGKKSTYSFRISAVQPFSEAEMRTANLTLIYKPLLRFWTLMSIIILIVLLIGSFIGAFIILNPSTREKAYNWDQPATQNFWSPHTDGAGADQSTNGTQEGLEAGHSTSWRQNALAPTSNPACTIRDNEALLTSNIAALNMSGYNTYVVKAKIKVVNRNDNGQTGTLIGFTFGNEFVGWRITSPAQSQVFIGGSAPTPLSLGLTPGNFTDVTVTFHKKTGIIEMQLAGNGAITQNTSLTGKEPSDFLVGAQSCNQAGIRQYISSTEVSVTKK